MDYNNNYLSTGNPFLDKILGGGFQLGSIILIFEDNATKLYQNIIKLIMSEGIISNDKVLFYYGNINSNEEIYKNLPYKSTQVENILNSHVVKVQEEDIKIAWRYENINYTNLIGEIAKNLKYIFDLSRPLQDNFIKQSIDNNLLLSKYIDYYNEKSLLQIINEIINDFQSLNTDSTNKSHNRLILTNFFESMQIKNMNINEIYAGLMSLKNMCRSLYGYTIITVNPDLIDTQCLNYLKSISDYIFRFNSLLMINENEKVGNYDAILYIDKFNYINNMCNLNIETDTYGVLKDKRKMIIEKIDIGVEIDRNTKVKECDLIKTEKNNFEF